MVRVNGTIVNCTYGHRKNPATGRCPTCAQVAAHRYRAKQQARTNSLTHGSGPLWQMLLSLGYVHRRISKTKPNSLGLHYRGP